MSCLELFNSLVYYTNLMHCVSVFTRNDTCSIETEESNEVKVASIAGGGLSVDMIFIKSMQCCYRLVMSNM